MTKDWREEGKAREREKRVKTIKILIHTPLLLSTTPRWLIVSRTLYRVLYGNAGVRGITWRYRRRWNRMQQLAAGCGCAVRAAFPASLVRNPWINISSNGFVHAFSPHALRPSWTAHFLPPSARAPFYTPSIRILLSDVFAREIDAIRLTIRAFRVENSGIRIRSSREGWMKGERGDGSEKNLRWN